MSGEDHLVKAARHVLSTQGLAQSWRIIEIGTIVWSHAREVCQAYLRLIEKVRVPTGGEHDEELQLSTALLQDGWTIRTEHTDMFRIWLFKKGVCRGFLCDEVKVTAICSMQAALNKLTEETMRYESRG